MISKVAHRLGVHGVHNPLLRDKVYEKLEKYAGGNLPAIGVALGKLIPSDEESLPFKFEYTTGVFGNRLDRNAFLQIFPDQLEVIDKTQLIARETDKFHLGSCGKAFTNLLIAELAENDNTIHGDITIGEVLPKVQPRWRDIKLIELVSHKAGIDDLKVLSQIDSRTFRGMRKLVGTLFTQTASSPFFALADLWRPYHEEQALYSGLPCHQRVVKSRHERITEMLNEFECTPNPKLRGSYKYSNFGYAVAAYLIEYKTGKNYEDLLREHIFDPLEMKTAGFGNCQSPSYIRTTIGPNNDLPITQPWGHYNAGFSRAKLQTYAQSELITVPDLLTPAGGMHASMEDWLKFLSTELMLARTHPERLYFHKSFGSPMSKKAPNIGYGWGWIIEEHKNPKKPSETCLVSSEPQHRYSILHNGSDTLWFSICKIDVERGLVIAAVTNASHLRSMVRLSYCFRDMENLLTQK